MQLLERYINTARVLIWYFCLWVLLKQKITQSCILVIEEAKGSVYPLIHCLFQGIDSPVLSNKLLAVKITVSREGVGKIKYGYTGW